MQSRVKGIEYVMGGLGCLSIPTPLLQRGVTALPSYHCVMETPVGWAPMLI